MQMVDYGLKRCEAWRAERYHTDESTTRRINLAVRKQQKLTSGLLIFVKKL